MNPTQYPVASLVVFFAFVLVLAFLINRYQIDPEDKGRRFDDTKKDAGEPVKEVKENRSTRRAKQFAGQTPEEFRQRKCQHQVASWKMFNEYIDKILTSNMSFNNAVNELLELSSAAITDYRNRSHGNERCNVYMTEYDFHVTAVLIASIRQYANRCNVTDVACVVIDVTRYMEEVMRIAGLTGLLYRNKGTHSNNQRYNALFGSLEDFFKVEEPEHIANEVRHVPFDQLESHQFMDNNSFRRRFYDKAIDGTYYDLLQVTSRDTENKREKDRQRSKKNNRKQRSRRVLNAKYRV